MASTPSKLAIAAALLVALWVITYWVTPAPPDRPVRISFGDSPEPDPTQPQPETDPPPEEEPAAQRPEPEPQGRDETAVAPPPSRTPDVLVDVAPEEIEGGPAEDATGQVIPPTFRVYESRRGDTFQSIAKRFYGSTARWRIVARANPGVDPNRFGPGTRLHLPVDPENIQGKLAHDDEEQDGQAGPPPPPEPEHTEYIVQRGDTLSEIAQALYGRATLWRRIADANPEVDPDRLRPGTTLRIPPPPAPRP